MKRRKRKDEGERGERVIYLKHEHGTIMLDLT